MRIIFINLLWPVVVGIASAAGARRYRIPLGIASFMIFSEWVLALLASATV